MAVLLVLVKKSLTHAFQITEVGINATIIKGKLTKSYVCVYRPPYKCDNWWRNLNEVVRLIKEVKGAQCCIMGDFNSRISGLNDCTDEITNVNINEVRESQDQVLNKEGKNLMDFINSFKLTILNGRTVSDKLGQWTFVSQIGKSVIDYIAVDEDLLDNVVDFAVCDVTDSDHFPIRVFFKRKVNFEVPMRRILDYKYQWNEILADDFYKECSSSFTEILRNNDFNEVNSVTNIIYEGIFKAAEKMKTNIEIKLGGTNIMHPIWWNQNCKETKKKLNLDLKKFRQLKTEEKLRIFLDSKQQHKKTTALAKNMFYNNAACKLANCQNSKTFWSTIKKFKSNKGNQTDNNITGQRWVEHFTKLLSNSIKKQFSDQHEKNEITPDEIDEITNEEVLEAVRNLKSGKAPGEDRLGADFFKWPSTMRHILIQICVRLFNSILKSGRFPKQWSNALLVLFFKKGDRSNPNNYRGISLLNNFSKMYTYILNLRLVKWMVKENILHESQTGSRKKYSTVDNIFTLNGLIDIQVKKRNRRIYACFIDFETAYDSVNRELLWKNLGLSTLPAYLIKSIRAIYKTTTCSFKTSKQETYKITTDKGIRQGCNLSATLFNFFIGEFVKRIEQDPKCHGISINRNEFRQLSYADDIVLLADSPQSLQYMLNVLSKFAIDSRININYQKTKIVIFRKGNRISKNLKWTCDKHNIEIVNRFCYLGTWFNFNGSWKYNSDMILSKTRRATASIVELCSNGRINSLKSKLHLWSALVNSMALYGAQIWGVTDIGALKSCKSIYLKRILGLPQNATNCLIYSETGTVPFNFDCILASIDYMCKISQMEEHRYPRIIAEYMIEYKTKWIQDLEKICISAGYPEAWRSLNYEYWVSVIHQFKINLYDQEINKIRNEIKNKTFLTPTISPMYTPINYLGEDLPFKYKKYLLMLRCNALPILAASTSYKNDKMCNMCNMNVIEDTYHFIIECPAYNFYRRKYIHGKNLYQLINLKNYNPYTACYIIDALNLRKQLNCI